ncbi:extracellular serine-rich [Fusarium albosuccineum]|uniref:Extracellular serine-rich n=1 Tax=Fusarium albosuccineum TaxID=1237068 RepID=A0A8H4PGC3_9HYPO|nr:extracellular serine-rich [Fusarium albosuccineum]
MHPSSFLSLAALPLALAQYGDSTGDKTTAASAAASSSASSADGVHVVKVGDGGLTFDPAEVTAAVGDTIEFHFYKGAHSVAQSNFSDPCQPINSSAIFSGPVKVDDGVSDEVFTVTIEDESPIWYYCATGQHCQNGMVGVINAPTTGQRTLRNYARAAANADSNVEPSSTGGGVLGPAATGTSAPSDAASATSTPGANGAISANGEIRWGLMSVGIAMAGFMGGLMI